MVRRWMVWAGRPWRREVMPRRRRVSTDMAGDSARAACQALRLDAAEYPETVNVKLPEGVKLADVALAAGNLIGR